FQDLFDYHAEHEIHEKRKQKELSPIASMENLRGVPGGAKQPLLDLEEEIMDSVDPVLSREGFNNQLAKIERNKLLYKH
mgnify:CR=1